MNLRKILIILLLLSLVAEAENEHRTPTKSDLLGTWEQVSQTVRMQHQPGDPFFLEFQLLEFRADGSFKQLGSNKVIGPKELELFRSSPATSKFTIEDATKGLMKIAPQSSSPQWVTALLFTKDHQPPANRKVDPARIPRAGDLLLAYRKPDGTIYLTRQLRRKR